VSQAEALKKAQEKDPTVTENTDVRAVKLYDIVSASKDEAVVSALTSAVPSNIQSGLDNYKASLGKYDEMKVESGRDVLKFAAWFPAILVVAFGFIALYFKSKGGYKPVELEPGEVSDTGH